MSTLKPVMNSNLSFMKRIRLAVLAAIALISAACSTSRYVAESTPVVDEITLLAPYCRVNVLERDGKFYYSDSLSFIGEMLIDAAIEGQGLPIRKVITVVGRSNQAALDRDYESIVDFQPGNISNTRIPSTLHAFLTTNSTRYALMVYSEGFVRSNPHAVLAEGQLRYASDIYLVLADVRTGRIVYFNRSRPEEGDPLSAKMISRRVKLLLEGLPIGK